MKKKRLNKEFGFIDYIHTTNEKYPNGLFIFMGSYINSTERGKGRFKEMIKELFTTLPDNTEIQLASVNNNINKLFTRLEFEKVNYIEYWGNTKNTNMMRGFKTQTLLNNI
jgi:hypothetical protein